MDLTDKPHDDVRLAKQYQSKADNAKSRGISFTLSFNEYKRLKSAKRCKLTGIELSNGDGGNIKANHLTIDRIDCSKGYELGNVIAVCHAANSFKAILEDPSTIITPKMAKRIVQLVIDVQKLKE